MIPPHTAYVAQASVALLASTTRENAKGRGIERVSSSATHTHGAGSIRDVFRDPSHRSKANLATVLGSFGRTPNPR